MKKTHPKFLPGDIVENIRDEKKPCFYVERSWLSSHPKPANFYYQLLGFKEHYGLPSWNDAVDESQLRLYHRPLKNYLIKFFQRFK